MDFSHTTFHAACCLANLLLIPSGSGEMAGEKNSLPDHEANRTFKSRSDQGNGQKQLSYWTKPTSLPLKKQDS
jgi:hypothetical protein